MPTVANRPRISVVVPCYKAADHVEKCLGSLLAQSLDPALFEVLLVFNGPKDAAEGVAQRLLERSSLRWRILHSEPGAGVARNAGVSHAEGEWVTFLDVDDELSNEYLEAMVAAASDPQVVPVAGVENVSEGGEVSEWFANAFLSMVPEETRAQDIPQLLSLNAAKLLPTEVMQRHPFDVALRSGEDVALYCDMFDQEGLRMTTVPYHQGARYRRYLTSNSVSRQAASFDFMVKQRLEVVRRLNEQLVSSTRPLDGVRRSFLISQCGFIVRFLQQNPQERDHVLSEIEKHDYPYMLASLRPKSPRQALVTELFPHPKSRATAELTAESWNLVSTQRAGATYSNATVDSALTIHRHDRVPVSDDPDSLLSSVEFCRGALASLASIPRLELVVTEGSWTVAHLVGALAQELLGVRWEVRATGPLRPITGTWSSRAWPWSCLMNGGENPRQMVARAILTGADDIWVASRPVHYALMREARASRQHTLRASHGGFAVQQTGAEGS